MQYLIRITGRFHIFKDLFGNNKLSKYINLHYYGDMMFKKFGDFNPISIIDPIDVDSENTKKSLKKVIKSVKDLQEKKNPAPIKKESENK